jgi:CheY-like chemotaxis protein
MSDSSASSACTDKSSVSQQLRILVVEDETLVSLFLEGLLDDMGHLVVGTAKSAAAAYAIAEQHRADLAVVDIGLRGASDGIEVATRLRQHYGLPSLLMTGGSHTAMHQRLEQAAPLGFLQKPYTQADVERVFEKVRRQL